jgi:multisubunit Na+/H+ antiporter MnhF subunit
MIDTVFIYTLYVALAVYVALTSYAVWRVWRGENSVDRLVGVDLISNLVLGVLVIITLIEGNSIFIDVALSLAALGFIGVIAFARYATDRQIF